MTYAQILFTYKIFSRIFATLSIFGPLILVPIVAYYFDNWWLLIGIAVCYIGGGIASAKSDILFYLATLFTIGFWIGKGFNIHQYVTFYFFCLLWGFNCYRIMMVYNSKREILEEKVYEMLKHEFTEGETGKKLSADIDAAMEKRRQKNSS